MNKNICVLIDDDEDDQVIFETEIHVSFPDYELRVFSRFVEAKHYLTENAHRIGPIFMDLNMPKANGIDCLNFLRSVPDYQDAPIIIYSTSKNPGDAQKSLKNGATAFISKPSRTKDLSTELSTWLNN